MKFFNSIIMQSLELVWYDASDESQRCSFCHGALDPLKKSVVVYTHLKSMVVRFHEDCYEHYFSLTNHDGAFPSNADWPVPVRRRQQNSGFFGTW